MKCWKKDRYRAAWRCCIGDSRIAHRFKCKSETQKKAYENIVYREMRAEISACAKEYLLPVRSFFSCERIHIPIRNSWNVYIICCYIRLCMQTLGNRTIISISLMCQPSCIPSPDTDVWTNNFRYRRRQQRRRRSRMFLCTKFATSGLLSRSIRFRCLIAAHEKPINYSSVYYTLTNVTFTWFHISIHFILEFIHSLSFFSACSFHSTKYMSYSHRMCICRGRENTNGK